MKYRIVEDTHSMTPWFRLEQQVAVNSWSLVISGPKEFVDRVANDLKAGVLRYHLVEEFEA